MGCRIQRFGPGRGTPPKNAKKHKSKTLKFDQKINAETSTPSSLFRVKKKKKQIVQTAAESQSIVVQDNSNSYNTGSTLSRLQMI